MPFRVLSLWSRRFGRDTLLADVDVADVGVADGGWPGSLFAALKGDEEGG